MRETPSVGDEIRRGDAECSPADACGDFLSDTLTVADSDISVSIEVTAATGNPNPGNECANSNTRDLVEIAVSIPFNKVALVTGSYLNGKTLTGRAAMRHE
jgi:hypothetical protein